MASKTILLKKSALKAAGARVYGIVDAKFREKTLPKEANENTKPAFRHSGNHFIFDKDSDAAQEIIDAIEEVAREEFKEKADAWIKRNLGEGKSSDNCCLKDGDERDEVTEDFEGKFFLNGKGQRRITVITPEGVEVGQTLDEDADGDEIPEGERVYSGMHIGSLKIEVWSYSKGKGGVACNVLGWRGLDYDAPSMESAEGGGTASKSELDWDDEEDEDDKPAKKPAKKAPPRK